MRQRLIPPSLTVPLDDQTTVVLYEKPQKHSQCVEIRGAIPKDLIASQSIREALRSYMPYVHLIEDLQLEEYSEHDHKPKKSR